MTSPRRLALDALTAIERGERAAAALGALDRGRLDARDRGFVTELVNGTTRMRRACDHYAAPFLRRDLDDDVRAAVRMGAYQLKFLGTPAHAAVNDTVEATPKRARGLVNAVLRRVADVTDPQWPSAAVENSYPDWLWQLCRSQWGDDGLAALIAMNTPEQPVARDDGYVQGMASQWVCHVVDAASPDGGVMVDACAAPGGKATGVGEQWSTVVATELDEARTATLARTIRSLRPGAFVVRADAAFPPLRPGAADAVLLDAPCSGLGALARRSDARWAISEDAIGRLSRLQKELLAAAWELVRPGGVVTYSVCTFTHQETTGVVDAFVDKHPQAELLQVEGDQWRGHGRGVLVLPQDHGTDAMAVFQLRKGAGDR